MNGTAFIFKTGSFGQFALLFSQMDTSSRQDSYGNHLPPRTFLIVCIDRAGDNRFFLGKLLYLRSQNNLGIDGCGFQIADA